MRLTLEDCWYLFLIVFVLAPWALLLVEGVSLFLTGAVLTSIPWEPVRVFTALLWPFFWGFIAAGVSG